MVRDAPSYRQSGSDRLAGGPMAPAQNGSVLPIDTRDEIEWHRLLLLIEDRKVFPSKRFSRFYAAVPCLAYPVSPRTSVRAKCAGLMPSTSPQPLFGMDAQCPRR